MTCTETVYWPELDSGTWTQICFAKAQTLLDLLLKCSSVGCMDRIPEWLKSVLGDMLFCIPEHRQPNGQHNQWQFSPGEQFMLSRTWILLLFCPQRVVVALTLRGWFSSFQIWASLAHHSSSLSNHDAALWDCQCWAVPEETISPFMEEYNLHLLEFSASPLQKR